MFVINSSILSIYFLGILYKKYRVNTFLFICEMIDILFTYLLCLQLLRFCLFHGAAYSSSFFSFCVAGRGSGGYNASGSGGDLGVEMVHGDDGWW